MRWGIIGAGDIVKRRVAGAIRESPGCELVAIARGRPDLAAVAAEALGARRSYPRWQDLVADAEIDAVYVATPVHVHAEQTIAAAEAGKHVLCEKPMAMRVDECDRMIAACRAHDVALGIAYYRRFYPPIERIKAIIASGELGAPVFAQLQALEWFDPTPEHPRYWLLDPRRAGGGPMKDFGCHRIEVLVNLFGPARVATGLTANVVFHRDVEDTAAVVMQLENGVVGSVVVTHGSGDVRDTIDIYGTAGSIHSGPLNTGVLTVRAGGTERTESHPLPANVHRPLVDDFVDAVQTGRPPRVDGLVGRAVAEVEDAVYSGVSSRGPR
jgi:predicted dehydrogenase